MEILRTVHSYMAYVTLLMLILAVFNAFSGLMSKRMFNMHRDLRVSLFALILSHLQLVIGLLLYFISASGYQALSNVGIGNLNSAARLLALEHPLINILAVALITVGWSRHKKFLEGDRKFKSIGIFYGLGLLLILSRIPWSLWFN